jgi:ubiquinone/menaquinone biosynthesis C-methylase UbiE
MLPRTLEPEIMDAPDDAADYEAMDHRAVNIRFVDDLLAAGLENCRAAYDVEREEPPTIDLLDLGTGTAQIPVLLCQRELNLRVLAVDAAHEMLHLARLNIEIAGLRDSIQLDWADCKELPHVAEYFDGVISNSIIHHIPEPLVVLREAVRVCRTGGLLFVRDLARPDSTDMVEYLVQQYAGTENAHQQQLFRESLHAALTVDEVRGLVGELGFMHETVQMTSDRHWTWVARK